MCDTVEYQTSPVGLVDADEYSETAENLVLSPESIDALVLHYSPALYVLNR